MLLKEIIGNNLSESFQNVDIKQISRNSKTVGENEIYFCLTKDRQKAEERCLEAEENGASFVVCNFDLPYENSIKVNNTRELFATACANFYHRACDDLKIVGVTGTNGKTTTAHIIAEMLKRNGKKCAIIGTNGVFYNGHVLDCPLTTPDADFLHKTFYEMREAGVEYVVMEVSAHAIEQKRVHGIMFEVGVLTNITQDHLDYFKNFEAYEQTKLKFFSRANMKHAVICVDDDSARKLIGNCDVPLTTYGLHNPCDTFAINTFCSLEGSRFDGNVCDNVVSVKTNLIGEYNIENCLAGLSVCHILGLNGKQLQDGLNFIYPVEGRFNVSKIDGKYVVIDFAHSPDSLMNVLKTARNLTDKKIYLVFGCGGNRDRDKRHKMGAVAEKYADVVCLTDDNPRFENSLDIIADIEKGMKKEHFVEPDRRTAIRNMIEKANGGDLIIIAGKGAEKYQEVAGVKKPYNDFDVVYECFENSNPIANRGKEW